tara:strand:+ start:327 stop:737 length:411 start_codon:yes stop_codon:yes gene_type:complete
MRKDRIKDIFKNQKIRFLISGGINFLFTNIVLQLLLFSESLSVFFCTFISQIINMTLGYTIYGTYVFKGQSLILKKSSFFKYSLLMSIIWIINSNGIELINSYGVNRNISAFILIPPLTIISYFGNKFIFQKNNLN